MITGDSEDAEKGWEVIPEVTPAGQIPVGPPGGGTCSETCLPQLRVRFALTN